MIPSSHPNYPAQPIEYTSEGISFEGYVVTPEPQQTTRPCIILMHEWSGLNDPTKHLAKKIAALGYICFALDVYGKTVRGDPLGDNSHLMNPLLASRELLKRRLLTGFEAARGFPGVDTSKIATVGYCFGGLCALDLARAAPHNLLTAISFHGILQPPAHSTSTHIDASILLLHGWEDPIAPPEDVLKITKELTNAGADWQLHAYGHAQHAFTFKEAKFPEQGIAYNAKADERSWATMATHLAYTFKK